MHTARPAAAEPSGNALGPSVKGSAATTKQESPNISKHWYFLRNNFLLLQTFSSLSLLTQEYCELQNKPFKWTILRSLKLPSTKKKLAILDF